MLPHHYHSQCSLCSTAWSQWFGELEERLLGCCRQGLDTWKTAARFGYVIDCCKVWIRERLLQGLDTWKTAALGAVVAWSTPSQRWDHVENRRMHTLAACFFSTAWGTHIEVLAAATVYIRSQYQFIVVCVHWSVSNVAPHWTNLSYQRNISAMLMPTHAMSNHM